MSQTIEWFDKIGGTLRFMPICTKSAGVCGLIDGEPCICVNGAVVQRKGREYARWVAHGNDGGSIPATIAFCPVAKHAECYDPQCPYNHMRTRYKC